MTLQGKGFYIWKVQYTEGGDNDAILALIKEAGLTHVLIKVANADQTYNYDKQRRIDLVAPLARLLKSEGITVWGWQYIYGDNPVGEARKAIQRVLELELDGFVVNAEKEFKQNGDPKVIWAAHFAGIEIGYCHMEKLANLSEIGRPFGFTVCCVPVKIKGASAGWTRPIAIIDE